MKLKNIIEIFTIIVMLNYCSTAVSQNNIPLTPEQIDEMQDNVNPSISVQEESLFKTGWNEYKQKKLNKAQSYFEQYQKAFPSGIYAKTVNFYLGIIAGETLQWDKACNILSTYEDSIDSQELSNLLYKELYYCNKNLLKNVKSIFWGIKLLDSGYDQENISEQIEQTISVLPEEQLEKLLPLIDSSSQWTEKAGFKLVQKYWETKNISKVKSLVSYLDSKDISVEQWNQKITQVESVDWNSIALLIPLEGRGKLVGERVKRGVEMAVNDPRFGKLKLILIDTSQSIENVGQQFERAITEQKICAAIGPISTGNESNELAKIASNYDLPLIILSTQEKITETGNTIFRFFHTESGEIEILSKTVGQNVQNITVYYPNNSYGNMMNRLFSGKISEYGNRIINYVQYEPAKNALKEEIETIVKGEPQVVFIPDSYKKIEVLAPALALGGLWSAPEGSAPPKQGRNIRLIMPQIALNKELIDQSQRYLQGAIWTGYYYPDIENSIAQEFFNRIMVSYGQEPTLYEFRGYDAVMIIREALKASPFSRLDFADKISQVSTDLTIVQFKGFTPSREPVEQLLIYTLIGNKIIKYEPSN